MKYWAWELEGTILEEKTKTKKKTKFLDPWSSLLPSFLKEKLKPDILAVFTKTTSQISGKTTVAKTEFPFWALVFPKRSYVPPKYPHLQLWFLGQSFAPSLSFVPDEQQKLMARIIKRINSGFDCFIKDNPQYRSSQRAFAINATPFSFIRNKEGRFYGGGQSVRTFHVHCFLMPGKLKKIELPEEKAPLVYPTTFSLALFNLIFNSEKIHQAIFAGKEEEFKSTKRGVVFSWKGGLEDLVSILNEIDEIFYKLQLSLIFAFYQDGQSFLDKLADFMTVDYLEKIKEKREKLVLLGKERGLEEARILLTRELLRLGEGYKVNFSKRKIEKICQHLTLDQNGDLSSWVGNKIVVLRPGMGYGCFVEIFGSKLSIHLSPLDSLFPEGTMESTGFLFVKKIKIEQKPAWLKKFLDCFQSSCPSCSLLHRG